MKKGFTLIELLVVISIISLLSSVVISSLNSTRVKGRDARRIQDLHQLETALNLYYNDYGEYPEGNAGSDRLAWINNTQNDDPDLRSPLYPLVENDYISRLPIDPGTNAYHFSGFGTCGGAQFYSYESNGNTYKLSTVLESKTTTGCKSECEFGWGGYQYCMVR